MFCPKCGRKNPDQNKFCNGCGAPLQVELTRAQPLSPPPPPKVSKPPINSSVSAETDEQRIKDFVRPKTVENNVSAENPIKAEKVELPFPTDAANHDKASYQENLSKVSEDAESLLDNIFTEKKSSVRSEEISAPPVVVQKPALHLEQPPKDNSYVNFSEVKNKYQTSEIQPRTNKNTHFIVAVLSIIALIIVGGVISLGWHFMSQSNNPAETSVVNKTPVIEKTTVNQPPEKMVFVLGGSFTMGGDEYTYKDKVFRSPPHTVSVKPFFIDAYEVTCEDYKKFIDRSNYPAPSGWNGNNFPDGKAKFPVTDVNWDAANAYSKWAGKRLPTEAEWEFAARGTDGRLYSWGNEWRAGMANADKINRGMVEVGTYKGSSPFGIYDMIGNAWEWTSTTLEPYPNGTMPNIDAGKNIERKIIRGGSWESDTTSATTTRRGFYGVKEEPGGYKNTSFRCVKDAPEK
jgi:formylglycine-generating enzyme required for sulfatase activity